MRMLISFLMLTVLTGLAHAGPVGPIIQDINRQLNLPYVNCISEMKIERSRRIKKKILELHKAVYPDGLEKTIVIIKEPRKQAGIKLLLIREKTGDIGTKFMLKDRKVYRSESELDSVFLKSSLINRDFDILEDVVNYSFSPGDNPDEIVAVSKNIKNTVYSKRIIKVHKMPDGSWVETEIKYFDEEGEFIKEAVSSIDEFVEIAPGVWRASKIVVDDGECKTTLIFKDWNVSDVIDERVFRL
jgi:hypothetical protein